MVSIYSLYSYELYLYPLTNKTLSDQLNDIKKTRNLPVLKTGIRIDNSAALTEMIS